MISSTNAGSFSPKCMMTSPSVQSSISSRVLKRLSLHAGSFPHEQKNITNRINVSCSKLGLCRRTEPNDADTQMNAFVEHGVIPAFSYRASNKTVQVSLGRPMQAVKTEMMGIATTILDRVVRSWGCVDQLIESTRGERVDRHQAEDYIEKYLKHHSVPGKLDIRWVERLNCGGKLQEFGRRNEPTARRLRLWINSRFAGIKFTKSLTAFANHEICTHALRAINDHNQVHRCMINIYLLSRGHSLVGYLDASLG